MSRALAGAWMLLAATGPMATAGEPAVATFGGGCFWCMEPPYDKLDGVVSTTSGYMGGHVDDPSYQQSHPAAPATWKWCRWPTTRK